MTDYEVYDFRMLLTRSKNVEWRIMITQRTLQLMLFLKTHDLLIGIDPFIEGGYIKSDLIIRTSNLSKEGHVFFDKVLPKWNRYLDKGGDVNNTMLLEKTSKKEGVID
jgi:hypothetical protein